MRHDDVKIGHVYLTRVSGDLVPVRVLYERRETSYGYRSSGARTRRLFKVCRCDNQAALPKSRTAAALRPCPESVLARIEPVYNR